MRNAPLELARRVTATSPRLGNTRRFGMYVVAQHQIRDPQAAFSRGEKLIRNEGAPAGVRGLQFYPSRDRSAVTCLWEADSVESIQEYVDTTLGNSSLNSCYEVDPEQAFAERPPRLPASPTIAA
jgi:hypothetical protein